MHGAQVAELYRGTRDRGNLTVQWTGTSARGAAAAPGAYLISATVDGQTTAKTFSLTR